MEKRNKCPLVKKCGGCNLCGETYEEYLKKKEDELNSLLGEYTSDLYDPHIRVLGMKDPYHYRHKVTAAFSYKKGEIISGIYEKNSHRVLKSDSCFIENETADKIIVTIRSLLKSFKIKVYDEDTGYGLLRYVMVRVGKATGQVMVILVVSDPVFPSKNNFVKELVKRHPEITTVILNVNSRTDSMVLGERNIKLYGPGKIEDSLCNVRYNISPQAFFQVNPEMTEKIYRTAIDFAKLKKTDKVIDAYCGIGTIALTASSHVEEVTGVELNHDAIEDAIENSYKNRIKNVRFIAGDAGDFMQEAAADGVKADVVFMDPPRTGSTLEFINAIFAMEPSRVVYVSCNPETLKRDLKQLTKKYKVKRIMGFDQFPWTEHVETVCLLSNRKPDSHIKLSLDMDEYYDIIEKEEAEKKK